MTEFVPPANGYRISQIERLLRENTWVATIPYSQYLFLVEERRAAQERLLQMQKRWNEILSSFQKR